MVEVFKTDVADVSEAQKLLVLIQQLLPGRKISFDLADCDKVLRVEGCSGSAALKVIELVKQNGFKCCVLE